MASGKWEVGSGTQTRIPVFKISYSGYHHRFEVYCLVMDVDDGIIHLYGLPSLPFSDSPDSNLFLPSSLNSLHLEVYARAHGYRKFHYEMGKKQGF